MKMNTDPEGQVQIQNLVKDGMSWHAKATTNYEALEASKNKILITPLAIGSQYISSCYEPTQLGKPQTLVFRRQK